jgi:hypothetical protein
VNWEIIHVRRDLPTTSIIGTFMGLRAATPWLFGDFATTVVTDRRAH